MNTAAPLQPKHTDWKVLYRAAILETNKSVLPLWVSEAEEAVLARGRDILYDNSDPEEKEALEDALYALRAFKAAMAAHQSCLILSRRTSQRERRHEGD